MTQISRRFLDEKVLSRILDVFLSTLIDIKSLDDARAFFNSVLSDTEQVMLAKRLAIALLLEKGYDYRSIEKLLKVSTTTIHSVNLKRRIFSREFSRTASKFKGREDWEKFWDEMEAVRAELSGMVGGFRKKALAEAGKRVFEKRRQRPF